MGVEETRSGVSAGVVTITPQEAKEHLDTANENRALSKRRVETWAKDMSDGLWEVGQPIMFDTDGRLLDGQHRLAAVVESGETITFSVITGVDPRVQSVVDVGRTRTYADHLRIHGYTDCNVRAAAVRLLHDYEEYGDMRSGSVNFVRLDEKLSKWGDVISSYLNTGAKIGVNTGLTKSIAIAGACLFDQADPDDARDFLHAVETGLVESDTHPAYALRRALARERNSYSVSYTRRVKLAMYIKAWNAYRLGNETQLIVFRSSGSRREQFPEVV